MKKVLSIVICLVLSFTFLVSCKKNEPIEKGDNLFELNDWDFTLTQLCGTDSLGRKIVPVGARKGNKYVGVYYMPWFGESVSYPYDISKLLEEYEDGTIGNPQNPLWAIKGEYYNEEISPNGAFHYWNEPLWGYYHSADPWVIIKQMELLAYAQVDFIMMDYTNSFTYDNATYAILNVIKAFTEKGYVVPKMAFMLPNNSMADSTLEKVVNKFISKQEYSDCFFVADLNMNPSGKPLCTADYFAVNNKSLIDSVWAKQIYWSGSPKDDSYFPAGDSNPIQYNFNGMMGVNVAINTSWFSDCYLYPANTTVYGRGWNMDSPWEQGIEKENVLKGTFFDMQYDKAIEEDVDLVFISCWNEFAAQKQAGYKNDYQTAEKAVFVDTFSPAFSKDVEPVKGELGDNYYLQLLEKTREFKHNMAQSAVARDKISIDIKSLDSWNSVKGTYIDLKGDAVKRYYQSVSNSIIYKDETARNDIMSVKISNDDKNLYIFAETSDVITSFEPGDDKYMNVLISSGNLSGPNGYDLIINVNPSNGETGILKYTGTTWQNAGKANYYSKGNCIAFAVPLNALNAGAGQTIGVKVTDNIPLYGEVTDFYLYGDSAPFGRLFYSFKIA